MPAEKRCDIRRHIVILMNIICKPHYQKNNAPKEDQCSSENKGSRVVRGSKPHVYLLTFWHLNSIINNADADRNQKYGQADHKENQDCTSPSSGAKLDKHCPFEHHEKSQSENSPKLMENGF